MDKLTKRDVKALRQADDVSFHFMRANGDVQSGNIRCTKKMRDHDSVFQGEVDHVIKVGHSETVYGARKSRISSAFEYIGSCRHQATWATIASLLREGDELILHWCVDGMRNEVMKDRDLHGDSLELIVQRGKKRLTFHVGSQCSLDNTARMCHTELNPQYA